MDITGRATRKIVKWCWSHSNVEDKRKPIIKYGIEVLVETVSKMLLLLSLGLILGQLYETVLVLVSFCILRCFAGGAHCKTNAGCTGAVLMILLGGLFLNQIFQLPMVIALSTYGINVCLLLFFAPADSKENKISLPKRRLINKGVSILYVSLLYFIVGYYARENIILMVLPVTVECFSTIHLNKVLKK